MSEIFTDSTARQLKRSIAEHIAEAAKDDSVPDAIGAIDNNGADIADLSKKLPKHRYYDRELSWLLFNKRVLELEQDRNVPLLERASFASIFASNLDEFFMVRVAGLKRRIDTGIAVPSISGLSPSQELRAIFRLSHQLQAEHANYSVNVLLPELKKNGVSLLHWNQLSISQQERLSQFFRSQVFPVLTPLAVDPAHPFPYISGGSLNLAVLIENPVSEKIHFARVKVPNNLPRLIYVEEEDQDERKSADASDANLFGAELDDADSASAMDVPADKPNKHHDAPNDTDQSGNSEANAAESGELHDAEEAPQQYTFIPLEDLIIAHLDALFPGMIIKEAHCFRLTRNEDIDVEEDDAENLLNAMEKELRQRRFGPPIRLELDEDMSPFLSDLLTTRLRISQSEVYRLPAPLDLTMLGELHDVDRPDLKYKPFVPHTNKQIAEVESAREQNIFAAIREGDILLHHPYDSFSTSVQAFLSQAAADPKVLAIKQTLYRTSGKSPIIDALVDAAQAGKQVLVLVEIKARFDEEANIAWARKLERAGCHVVYGIVGLKTHCKLSLVVRQEHGQLRRYCHIGTGNYNPKTARIYTDLGLLTCDPVIGQDITRLFNQLSGYAPKTTYHRLLVAPRTIRSGLLARIRREEMAALNGKEAWIKIKVNSLVDEKIIDALYRASQAGVKIDCVVRGICSLKPGIPGLSENIRVHSILGRFLEHSRIFAFANSDGPQIGEGPERGTEVWIGSADLMHRNLDRRVEALVRISNERQIQRLLDYVDLQMAETTSSWWEQPNGTYIRHCLDENNKPLEDAQRHLIKAHNKLRKRRRDQ